MHFILCILYTEILTHDDESTFDFTDFFYQSAETLKCLLLKVITCAAT